MKFQLPENAFPPLVLSAREEQDLIDEADRIIEETIAAQDKYIARGRRVQDRQWKHLRTKEGMNVYRQRSVGSSKKLFDPIAATDDDRMDVPVESVATDSSVASPSWTPVHDHRPPATASARTPMGALFSFRAVKTPCARRAPQSTKNMPMLDDRQVISPTSSIDTPSVAASSDHGWMEYQRKPPHVPGILAVGVVDGKLEDAMHGVFSEDDASWRWKSSQINDKLDDARVLATIRGPTRDDPFRFIGVKWFTKEHPNALSSIVKRRDFLTIEAMGTTYDSTGTVRLGYFMMHSVEIPRIPELSDLDILRGRVSFCFILRQVQSSAIEIFVRGFSDPQGEMYEGVSVRLASDSILAAVKIVDFAHIKKLRWLMMNRKQNTSQLSAHEHCDTDLSICKTCRKSVNRLSSFLQGSSTCQVCHDVICGKCTVTKHITADISIDGATQKPLPFCLPCVMEAKNLSAWDIALEGMKQRQYSLLPPDLFPTKQAVPVRQSNDSKGLRRAASAPRLPVPRSNSRTRSASQSVEQQTQQRPPPRRRNHGMVLLTTELTSNTT